jgi:hydrogenase nickel incorporation protein HypA/HybF
MHEMSIAIALVEQLQRIAVEQRAARIVEIELECGVMRQVVPEALQLAFQAASADTAAAGAQLRISAQHVVAKCRECGTRFAPSLDDYRCPDCGQACVEVVSGQDILLKSVVCET